MAKNDLTHELLKSLLHYDPETGAFTHIKGRHKVTAGMPAGTTTNDGYCQIYLLLKGYKAHRLAWLYMTGAWPTGEVDHIDLNRLNNRFSNLRDATGAQNRANCSARLRNPFGLKGVDKIGERYRAAITINRKRRHLGVFDTPEEAHAAYLDAAVAHWGQFARGS